jgi:hypothetical protein
MKVKLGLPSVGIKLPVRGVNIFTESFSSSLSSVFKNIYLSLYFCDICGLVPSLGDFYRVVLGES